MNELSRAERSVSAFLRNVLEASRLEITFTVTMHPAETPPLTIRFDGPDTNLLIAHDGDLLESLRYLASVASGLDFDEGDSVGMVVADQDLPIKSEA